MLFSPFAFSDYNGPTDLAADIANVRAGRMNGNRILLYFKNTTLSHSVLFSYFATYLIGSIYFKHFVFDTYEKWKIFLNIQ